MAFGIGAAERRKEDDRLLAGRGRYVDDIVFEGQVYGHMVRSPHAHARIRAIETEAAAALPGVCAVFTAADLAAADMGPIPCPNRPDNADGTPSAAPARPVLADGIVRMVGDPVAFVTAENPEAARDAAEAVRVSYAPLPAVTDAADALTPGAPLLHADAPGNLCVDWEKGDRRAVDEALLGAAHCATLEVRNRRLAGCPMEPRVALGRMEGGVYILETGTQGVHMVRSLLAREVLKVPESRVRVVTPDVGGAFGVRLPVYPEHALVLFAARILERPVKWVASRGEALATDHQGRDTVSRATLGLDGDGRFVALKVESIANLGAYPSQFGPFIPTAGGARALAGPYGTPLIHVRVRAAYTNTAPTDAYRGAGRPESVFLLERLIDEAAHALALDPAELRRRNLVPRTAMPYGTALGQTYDSGDFPAILETACAESGWEQARARRRAAAGAAAGADVLRGIGLAFYVDPCGGNRDQWAALRFDPDGTVTLLVGSQSTGQGHETAYAQIVASRLGLAREHIRVRQGDTASILHGRGTSGSRSLPIGGNAVLRAADEAAERGRPIAAFLLAADEEDVTFADGRYRAKGSNRTVGFAEAVRASFDPTCRAEAKAGALDGAVYHTAHESTYSNGCHVCEVAIDRATGAVRIVRYVAVDDFGRLLNPLLVEGQRHGAIAQGIGQALAEHAAYDAESGQLLAGSFMDYALPRAGDLPLPAGRFAVIPCETNALGVKGCGEAGAIAAPAAVMNAVADALRAAGAAAPDMPATPEAVWRALRHAEGDATSRARA